jgi:hypothetical protein
MKAHAARSRWAIHEHADQARTGGLETTSCGPVPSSSPLRGLLERADARRDSERNARGHATSGHAPEWPIQAGSDSSQNRAMQRQRIPPSAHLCELLHLPRARVWGPLRRRRANDLQQSSALARDTLGELRSSNIGHPAQHRISIHIAEAAVCVEVRQSNFSGMQFEQQVGTAHISGRIASARVQPINDHRVRSVTQNVQWVEVAMT